MEDGCLLLVAVLHVISIDVAIGAGCEHLIGYSWMPVEISQLSLTWTLSLEDVNWLIIVPAVPDFY